MCTKENLGKENKWQKVKKKKKKDGVAINLQKDF